MTTHATTVGLSAGTLVYLGPRLPTNTVTLGMSAGGAVLQGRPSLQETAGLRTAGVRC